MLNPHNQMSHNELDGPVRAGAGSALLLQSTGLPELSELLLMVLHTLANRERC